MRAMWSSTISRWKLAWPIFRFSFEQIKSFLEQRDFVSLGDTLLYETSDTTQSWLACMDAVRQLISA
jgi:hypothetical protein